MNKKDNSVKQSKFSSILKSGGGADIGKWAKHLFNRIFPFINNFKDIAAKDRKETEMEIKKYED